MAERERRRALPVQGSATEWLTPRTLRGWMLPQVSDDGKRGSLLIVAGSAECPGASTIAALSALRVGARSISIATPPEIATGVGLAVPETTMIPFPEPTEGTSVEGAASRLTELVGASQATLIGPGIANETGLAELLGNTFPALPPVGLVLADTAIEAIRACPDELYDSHARCVLILSIDQLARLMDEPAAALQSDSAGSARRAAARFSSTVVLTGSESTVVDPAGRIVRHRGRPWSGAASAALPGTLAGLLAGGTEAVQAGAWAIYLCATASERLTTRLGPVGHLTHELLAEIPLVLGEMMRPTTTVSTSSDAPRRRGRRS